MTCSIPNPFRHVLSYVPIQGASNSRCLHTVSMGASLYPLVTYVILSIWEYENWKFEVQKEDIKTS